MDAKPGAQVSGDSSGLNPKLKAPTQKSAILAAKIAVAKAELALLLLKGEAEQMDDDSTSGAQSAVPAKAEVPTKKDEIKGLPDPQGESHAGEGAAQALDTRDVVSDEDVTGAAVTGKVKGKTLDTSGLDAKLIAPTTKADGNTDGDIGKKGKGNELDESMSGAGAQEANVQTMKAENAAVMGAIQALAKSVKDSIASVTKTVGDLRGRLETVATLAKKNDAALHGTVLGEAGDDAAAWTQKSERDSAPPLLDTAFSRRRA